MAERVTAGKVPSVGGGESGSRASGAGTSGQNAVAVTPVEAVKTSRVWNTSPTTRVEWKGQAQRLAVLS